jgi:hypothetical protein
LDVVDRQNLLGLMSWFSSFCGVKPINDLKSDKEMCRYEFAGLLFYILTGEPRETEFNAEKDTDDSFSKTPWYLTTFRSMVDEDCEAANLAGDAST